MEQKQTIRNLNTALQMEITATHQYQLHAQVLDDWGLPGLAEMMRQVHVTILFHATTAIVFLSVSSYLSLS